MSNPYVTQVATRPAPAVKAAAPAPRPLVIASMPQPIPAPKAIAVVADFPATRTVTQPIVPPTSHAASERSRVLLTEAHDLAARAATPADYAAVVQRCRYVLAIDQSAQAVAYASQLAAWSLTERGELLLDADRLVEAESDFQEAVSVDAACWQAHHNLGVIEAQRGATDAARARFTRTIELNPNFAKAHSNRAALAVQAGAFADALDDYARAIAVDPDLALAHSGRGRVCHLVGRLDEALRHFDAAELLSSNDASVVIARGDLLVDLGRYGHAKASYERASAIDPQNVLAHRNLAWMLATCPVADFRNSEAALAASQRAMELAKAQDAIDDITLDTHAAALAAAGRFDEATKAQQLAIETAPEADAVVYRERLALYTEGKPFTTQPAGRAEQATYTK